MEHRNTHIVQKVSHLSVWRKGQNRLVNHWTNCAQKTYIFCSNFLALCFLSGSLQAQVYESNVLSLINQDAVSEILCLYQDPAGFVWIGTELGLWRYDGKRLNNFETQDQQPIVVTAILSNRDTLFAGTREGTVLFLNGDHQLVPLPSEEGFPSKQITALVADHQQRIWLGTAGEGIYLRQGQRWYQTGIQDGLPSLQINAMIRDERGGILAGTDKGLIRMDQSESDRTILRIVRGGEWDDPMVTALASTLDQGVMVGYYTGGIALLNPMDSETHPLSDPFLWEFGPVSKLASTTGRWWVGTEDKGLYVATEASGQVSSVQLSGIDRVSQIRNLLALREGQILSVNAHGQLFSFDPKQCPAFPGGIEYGETQAVMESRDGTLWFSTLKGLYRYKPDTNSKPELFKTQGLPPNAVVVSIFEGEDLSIWLGTFDQGAFQIVHGSDQAIAIDVSEANDQGSVLAITEASGLIWFATLGGVYAAEHGSRHAEYLDLGIGKNFVYSLFPDQNGGLWVGTDGDGAFYIPLQGSGLEKMSLKPGALLHRLKEGVEPIPRTLKDKTVYKVLQDARGRVWFQTREKGLMSAVPSPDRMELEPTVADFPASNEELMSIALDGNGVLVLIHERSAHWVPDPGQLTRPINFDEMRDRPRPMSNAIYCRDTRVWIGTNVGPYRLQGSLREMQAKPVASISEALASGKPVVSGNRIIGGGRHMEFLFVAPWTGSSEPVLFEYQLEGLQDEAWRGSLDVRASYTNLPPGDYTFRLRARFKDDVIPGPETHFTFSIPTPIYARPWFIGLLIICFLALIRFWVRWRERLLKEKEEIEKNKIRSQYELLRNQVNPHFLFNSFNTLSGLIEEDPGRAQKYVERMAGFFRNILAYRNEELISLKDELRILQDYLSIQHARYEDNLQVEIRISEELMSKAIPPMTLQILVENALKHNVISRLHPMSLIIEGGTGHSIRVINHRKPRPKAAEGTGLGLENLSRKFHLLGAVSLKIFNEGEQFIVEVPLLNLPKLIAKHASVNH